MTKQEAIVGGTTRAEQLYDIMHPVYHTPWPLKVFMILIIGFLIALTFDFFRAAVTHDSKASPTIRGLVTAAGFVCSMGTALLIYSLYVFW